MKKIAILFLFCTTLIYAQKNAIDIKATLDVKTHELHVQQEIVYHNNSSEVLDSIYLHNWPNAYKSRKTALSKRLITDYKKGLYFASEKDRGKNTITSLSVAKETALWNKDAIHEDIIAVKLNKPLKPKETITITANYTVQIPKDSYTRYGRNNKTYNLRYWYLVPAHYDNGKWQTMHNLNMDDMLMDNSDYTMQITVPKEYQLQSQLTQTTTTKDTKTIYKLQGENCVDINLLISTIDISDEIKTKNILVATNLRNKKVSSEEKEDILNRELDFIEKYLGAYPHPKMFVSRVKYKKNPVYGLSQLPSKLAPFSNTFEWDIKMFKIISKEYIDNTLLVNRRTDAWVVDGIQIYLMIKYLETYYPKMKFLGNISKIWGIRSYNYAKMTFNDKYPFIYQSAARNNLDQALTTRADSLSNLNRKLTNKYKAGLGLQYLDDYLQDSIIPKTIKEFYAKNILKNTNTKDFNTLLKKNTSRNIDWFFTDYLNTDKKIDYTIKKIKKQGDSLKITIKNKRDFTAPIALYGLKDKEIQFKKWYVIDSTQTITIPKENVDKLILNYHYTYPEINARDNWKNVKKRLFNKPLQIRMLDDLENPNYTQLLATPVFDYNLYDGITLGMAFSNKTRLRKNFNYKFTPTYSTKSKDLTGSFSLKYQQFVKHPKIQNYLIGLSGNYYHYAPDLTYQTFSPFVRVNFNRKKLRDAGGSSISLSYKYIDREPDLSVEQNPEENKYNVLSLSFKYAKPEIIQDFRYAINYQLAQNFSKASAVFQYRKLTNANRQFDFRLYFGTFINNKTTSDYFNFGLHNPSDYLFQYDYFGRSEDTGFFSQEFINAEGGFKSKVPVNFANEWLGTFNSSVGVWRWLEVYGDVGFVKNRGISPYFAYESGIRFNFVHDIFEFYFPVYSNLGWEIAQPKYATKIRFTFTLNPKKIVRFFRRGFF